MEKNIKQLEFSLENCEGIIIPYTCFKKLSINGSEDLSKLKDNDDIVTMECSIINNGRMSYSSTYSSNKTSPIDRLSQYDDIVQVRVVYEDGAEIKLGVGWYFENEYDSNSDNANQTSNKESYNLIHIEVKPFIKKYTIQEVFKFPVGTIVEMIDNGIFIIDEYKGSKCFKGAMFTEYLVNGMYTLV